jgi:hypothetical protein
MQQQKVAWEVQSEMQSSPLRLRSCMLFSSRGQRGSYRYVCGCRAACSKCPWNPWLRWFTQGSRQKGTNEASHQSTDNGPLSRRYPRPCLAACSMQHERGSPSDTQRLGEQQVWRRRISSPLVLQTPPILLSIPSPMDFAASVFVRILRHEPPRNETVSLLSLAKWASPIGGLLANPSAHLTRQNSSAETRDACGRVAISSSADSPSVTGHGYTRTRGCDHLKLDRSLVKRSLHLYLAEPPSFTPVEHQSNVCLS